MLCFPYFVNPQQDYSRTGRYLRAIARLKPGISMAQATAQMKAIAARAERENPNFSKGWGVRMVDLREEVSGEYRRPLLVLLGAVGLVLLIACENVASLRLARATSRGRELAIRTSLDTGFRADQGGDAVREACRDARGVRWIEDAVQDARYAIRSLARNRGFTAAALVALALGIGANTAM